MAGPRYKLDLVSYDDPGALLPMPMPAEPSRSALLPPDSEALDLRLAQDATLVDLLSDVLQKADISFVQPISMDAATAVSREQLASTSHLAARLLAHQPLHFQYGTIDVEPPATGPVPATPVAATPGPSGGLAVAAHNSQPDTQPHGSPKRRKTDPEEVPAAEKKRQRKAPKQEVYVMSGEEADIAAGKLASSLEATLAAAARAAEEGGSDDEGDDEDEEQQHDDEEGGDGRGRRRQGQPGPPCRFSLAALQALHRELRTGQAQGLLRLLPTPLLQALLRALGQAVAAGRDRVLRDDAEAKSRAVQRVSRALEAELCALVVLSSPGLPTSLYMEELLGDAVGLAQHCLQLNVLALHDPRFKRMYRPGELEEEEETKTKTSRRGRPAAAPGMFIPRWCGGLVAQLEQALGLLAEVVAIKCVPAEGLIPLARASQQALTVEALSTMHYRALGLAVAMFRFYPAQRHVVVEELVQGVVAHLNPGKHMARHYPLQSTDPPVRIQMVAALVMQLVQAAPELPAADAGAQAAAACANPASSWADFLWGAVLARLPGAKAAKQETHADLRAWLEAVVEDLLAALCLPEWPAAGVLLRRLILALNGEGGMKSPDSGARLAALDLLGLLARSLWGLARAAEAPEAARAVLALVDEALASAGGAQPAPPVPPRLVAEQLVLEHLADAAHSGAPAAELPHSHHGHHHSGAASSSSSAHLASSSGSAGSGPVASARTLLACSMLADSIRGWRQAHADKMPGEKVANEAILRHRQIYDRQRSCLGASTSGLPHLSRESAVGVCRWLVAESMLGRSRPTLVRWLAEVGGSGRSRQEAHAANVRSKAIKLLGGVIEVDVRVLSLNDVQEGIKNALADDSVLVREAAVDLIGKHISRSSELAVQYYDILVRASEDTGLTVRKRAIKLLWECCVRCPDFKHRSDALMRIVSRATDPEDTMRAAVTKICAEIWFLPRFHLDDDDEGSAIARDPRQRAAQLGEVVATVYRALGPAHPVPFTASMPVVATIRGIVGEEGRPEVEAVRSGAREVADALLERALELQGEPDPAPGDAAGTPAAPGSLPLPPGEELFQALLALHALAAADVRLLLRPRDPQRVVRCLAPYIKELPSAGPPGSDPSAAKRRAEQLLAVLAVLGCCVGALRHLDEGLADEIVGDLKAIALKVTHVQVVSVACQCLCALAGLKPRHRATVRELAGGLYSFLEGDRAKQVTANPERRRMYPRFMYTLGMLCRYGADMLDEAVEGSKHPSCASALELVLRMYSLLGDSARHQEAALQAMGNIFIARPSLAVDVREVRPVLEGALAPSAPAALKCRCLGSLAELLRAEEEALVGRQAAARREAKDAGQASTAPEAEAKALARRNGEGDTGSVSSGLIQMLWERVLALATDVTPTPAPGPSASGQTPPATPNGTGSQNPGATVRRRALDLVEVVIRGGIVVPWSAMPALTALATDPERDTAARALGCLRAVVAANTAFVAGQVPAGVAEAYAFHCRLAALERPGQPPQPDKCAPLVEGLAAVWTAVFGVERALKAKFLAALLKPLDDGCCLASGSAAKSDPHLLAFLAYVVAELPYRKMDELLALLGRINEILSRRAEAVLGRFQQLRQDESEGGDKANGGGPGASTPVAGGGPRASAANGLPATVRAAYAVSLLLLLKQYLRLSYDLTADRVAKYDPSGPQRKVEEKLNAVHNGKLRFNASRLRADVAAAVGPHPHGHGQAPGGSRAAKVSTPSGPTAAAAGAGAGAGASTPSASRQGPGAGAEANGAGPSAAGPPPGLLGEDALRAGVSEVFKVLRTLMKTDEMDYKQAVAAAAAAEEAAVVQGSPGEGAQGLDVAAMMAAPDSVQGGKPPLATKGRGRGRGRGSRGGAAGAAGTRGGRGTRGGGARGAAGGRGRGRGRGRKRKADSDEEDEEDEEEDEDEEGADEEGTPKKPKRSAGSTRRRLVE